MNKTTPTPRRLATCNRMVDKIDALLDGRADRRLEDAADLPRNKLNKIRNGRQYMRADEIWRISQALRVDVKWLLNDDDPALPQDVVALSDVEITLPDCHDAHRKRDRRNKP